MENIDFFCRGDIDDARFAENDLLKRHSCIKILLEVEMSGKMSGKTSGKTSGKIMKEVAVWNKSGGKYDRKQI